MELAKSLNELNKKAWYRVLKAVFIVSFLTAQIVGFHLVRSRTEGEVIAPISFKLIGRLVKEEMTAYGGMTDEQAGRAVYQKGSSLWSGYVAKYEEKYVIDPIAWYRQYSEIQRAEFCAVAFLAISLFFEIVRRAFYYVIFGKVFPPKKRRKRRTKRSIPAE